MRYPLVPVALVAFLLMTPACGNPEEAPFDPAPWIDRGVAITSTAFSVMSNRLVRHLEEGGVPAAIDYCSLAAYPMTDSLSEAFGATIRRTALRYRNPANAPNDAERTVLEHYARVMAEDGRAAPTVERSDDGSVSFYAPIVLLQPCTRCHGSVGERISDEDYALIRERYPADSATGFSAGDLRGIWSIRFEPE